MRWGSPFFWPITSCNQNVHKPCCVNPLVAQNYTPSMESSQPRQWDPASWQGKIIFSQTQYFFKNDVKVIQSGWVGTCMRRVKINETVYTQLQDVILRLMVYYNLGIEGELINVRPFATNLFCDYSHWSSYSWNVDGWRSSWHCHFRQLMPIPLCLGELHCPELSKGQLRTP